MSEFHDPELRQQLARMSGPFPDDNAAFAMWQGRVRQARRRRAVMVSAAAVLSVIIGTVTVSALQQPTHHTLVPGQSADSSIETRLSTTSTERASTTESTEVGTTAPVVTETSPIVEPIDTSMPEVSTAETEAAGGNSGPPATKPHGGTQPGGAPTAPPAAAAMQTFPTAGGTVVVQQNGDQLALVSATAVPGFQAEQGQTSGTRVRVTFESEGRKVQITIKLVDGTMVPVITDEAKGHDGGTPDSTESDGGGGGKNGN